MLTKEIIKMEIVYNKQKDQAKVKLILSLLADEVQLLIGSRTYHYKKAITYVARDIIHTSEDSNFEFKNENGVMSIYDGDCYRFLDVDDCSLKTLVSDVLEKSIVYQQYYRDIQFLEQVVMIIKKHYKDN